MESYLSSFGASPIPAESQVHEIFKRSSKSRKVKKTKKVSTTTETSFNDEIDDDIPTRPLAAQNNAKNFTVSPRHIVQFELDDAKYSEEYEKLRQSRKLRVKRSSSSASHDDEKYTNATKKSEKFITKETFVQPRELFRFSYLDAVTKAPNLSDAEVEMNESEKKTKREVSDSAATDSKRIHVSYPMRGQRSTKHVSYDEISQKLQKMIDGALYDAVQKGKASDGDYLKFFYGDKIIKVPVSMSKYIASKSKETTFYGKKNIETPEEPASASEAPQLLATKNSYLPLKNSGIKFDSKPNYIQTSTEKAESYVNFATPIVVQPDIQENKYPSYKKSVYYYANDGAYYPKNSVSSPGPVVFDEPTTPSSIEQSQAHYKNFIYHPPTKISIVKDAIPITEHVDESYIPYVPEKSHVSIPKPTSYVEYGENHDDYHDHDKSYEFG